MSLEKKVTINKCAPHFFIYHSPTKEINCMAATKLYSAGKKSDVRFTEGEKE
jgi:hypothetical protein